MNDSEGAVDSRVLRPSSTVEGSAFFPGVGAHSIGDSLRVVHCRSCNAEIVWLKTKAGKSMPVDAATVKPGDTEFEHGRHMSHFGTCPQAKRWSKKGKR